MSDRTPSPLEAELLALPSQERARLAHLLLASLDDPDEDACDPATVEREWVEEIRRRIDDLDSGRVKAIPTSEALARIRRRLR